MKKVTHGPTPTQGDAPGGTPAPLPLQGIRALDFGQYLAAPAAALRLADLGAEVLKVEQPAGDGSRRLLLAGVSIDGESANFQTINRNKRGVTADLKDPKDRAAVDELVRAADVLVHNFRPGVAERLGLDYKRMSELNPRLVYGTITGYGTARAWAHKPGQDLLAQSLAGLPWLNGGRDDPPVPVGQAVADMAASGHLVQGILACLLRRGVTGRGGLVEVSLLESVLDVMFEAFTAFLNGADGQPARGPKYSAHPQLGAPYGVYPTSDGFLALAMTPVPRLGELLDLPELLKYVDPASWFTERDAIIPALAARLSGQATEHWLAILEAADIWCGPVLTWPELLKQTGFQEGQFTQTITSYGGQQMLTTRCPIRLDGRVLKSPIPAPRLGQHNREVFPHE